ncbi:dihydroorotate dehydrogenase [Candidatus Woesearchaeota archaeon CG_4_10_14_0_2_um_filter_33_10]|nr:MAG: dihydroorotate dehydrogenase B catalytic subunit [Candidatus Woesearchaeota archaeon CG1_02_33_12]PIU72121.1 MAG: dihydroorotate dehydrogenase [Candidatus Woesearchaeota archaeon CG06_land_8_20_14_3_00_33_13]PIZ52562.1 MAG: dihydroorotate dehydrogenase [Candidatus Woesearchaeota archaeon CG_4_10_14_0_2_um_filter_33_10]
MLDLSTYIAGVKLKNPTILSSGIFGTSSELIKRAFENNAGAATIKSIGPVPRDGNNNPNVIDFGHGLLNAVGLPSPGYKNMDMEFNELSKIKDIVIWSIYGSRIEDYIEITEHIIKYNPKIIELNISCPNKESGMLFSQDKECAADVTRKVKHVAKNSLVVPKLSPNVSNIAEIAYACEKAGADAITAINTLQGMVINIDAKKPVLYYKKGGMSGPAIKPVAVRCVYDIYEKVSIPIIGTGGIMNGRDAIEMIQAGASAVGIGSAVYYQGIGVFGSIVNEIKEWMQENNCNSIKELIGIAHK